MYLVSLGYLYDFMSYTDYMKRISRSVMIHDVVQISISEKFVRCLYFSIFSFISVGFVHDVTTLIDWYRTTDRINNSGFG